MTDAGGEQTSGIRKAAAALRWSGWLLVLACVFLRAISTNEPFPHWDVDPTRMPTPITGLAPAASQIVDALIMLGAGAALLGGAAAGIMLIPTLLLLLGSVGIWAHTVGPGATLDDARLGATWIAAMTAALAAAHVCRDPRLRRITLAAAVGIIVMLAAKSALQILVEHAATLRQYRMDPEAFLRSQGWTAGSSAARTFERRLRQPEATGWFGLANVLATFAAGSLVALLGWTFVAWRQARSEDRPLPDGWAGLLTLGALAAAATLWFTGGKGGITAAAIGLSLLAGGMLLGRAARLGRLISPPPRAGTLAVLLVLSAVLAVALRGLIGMRAGELSLLFRWFYIEGAARIMAEHPVAGVGPAGFKDAYMLAKPPLSPEEVSSPHSVLFDFASAMGVFGLAWAGLFLGWVYRAGVVAAEAFAAPAPPGGPPTPSDPRSGAAWTPERLDAWALTLVAAAPTLVASWLELRVGTPEGALVRLLGLAGWVGVAMAALALMRTTGAWRWIAALAALTLAVHGQIEVTPVWPGSAALLMVILAGAGAGGVPARTPRSWTGTAAAMAVLAAGIAWAAVHVSPVVRWQRELTAAAAAVEPVMDINFRLQELERSGVAGSAQRSIFSGIMADLGAAVGHPIPADQAGFERAMDEFMALRAPGAIDHLAAAASGRLRHFPTVEALARLTLTMAGTYRVLGATEQAAAMESTAEAIGKEVAAWRPATAGAAGLEGNIQAALAELRGDRARLDAAIAAWERAAALDPYGLSFPLRIFSAHLESGDKAQARRWAARLLELNNLQRLDEVRQLSDEDRARAERALGTP